MAGERKDITDLFKQWLQEAKKDPQQLSLQFALDRAIKKLPLTDQNLDAITQEFERRNSSSSLGNVADKDLNDLVMKIIKSRGSESRVTAFDLQSGKFSGSSYFESVASAVLKESESRNDRLRSLERILPKGRVTNEMRAEVNRPFSMLASAPRRYHQTLLDSIVGVTSNVNATPDEKLYEMQKLKGMMGSVSEEQKKRLEEGGSDTRVFAAEINAYQQRVQAEISNAERVIHRQAESDWRHSIDVSASPTEVTESGDIRNVSTRDRIARVQGKTEELKQQFVAADEGRKKYLGRALQSAAGAHYRLRVAETREQASAIAEEARPMPFETEGGWRLPMLAEQRGTSERALKEAETLKSSLGVDATPEQIKTSNELLRRMVEQLSRIDNTIKQGQEELKLASVQNPIVSRFMKQQPDEEDSDYAKRVSERGAYARAIAGSLFSSATVGVQATAAIKQQTADMARRTIGLASAVEGTQQSQFLDSLSFSASNRARFGGDILFGDMTLGRQGHALSKGMADTELAKRRNADAWSLGGQGMQALLGLGQLVGGAATIAVGGWTGIGGMLGAGLMAGGIGTLGGALTGAAGNTRLQETGLLNFAGPYQEYANATRQAQWQQARDDLMNSALSRNRVNVAQQESLERGLDTWGQNVRMAGAWAVNPLDLVSGGAIAPDEAAVGRAGAAARSRYVESMATVKAAPYQSSPQMQYYKGVASAVPSNPRLRGGYIAPEGSGESALPGAFGRLFMGQGRKTVVQAESKPVITYERVDEKQAQFLQNQAEAAERRKLTNEAVVDNSLRNDGSFFARYGMSAEDWSAKASMVNAQLGMGMNRFGTQRGEQAAQRLYGMGLAGVGGFEQLAGNAAAISNLTGKTDSTADLRRVLSDAVRAGFDNSRTGQMFVQSVTGLANTLGIRGATGVSDQLRFGTQMAGGTEKDLEVMGRGMSTLPGMFEQSRVVGGLNFAAFVAGGGLEMSPVARQFAFDVSKNPQRALKVNEDVQRIMQQRSKNPKAGESAQIMSILDSMKDIDPAVRDVLLQEGFGGVQRFRDSSQTGLQTLSGFSGAGKALQGLLEKLRKGKLQGADARRAVASTQGQLMGNFLEIYAGDENASRAAAQLAVNFNTTEADRKLLQGYLPNFGSFDSQESKAQKAAQQAAIIRQKQVATQSALLAGGASTSFGAIGQKEIDAMAAGTGKVQFVNADRGRMEISADRAKEIMAGRKAEGANEEAFKRWATETNKLQASLQQEMLSSLESVLTGKTQEVRVVNWREMVVAEYEFKQLTKPGEK